MSPHNSTKMSGRTLPFIKAGKCDILKHFQQKKKKRNNTGRIINMDGTHETGRANTWKEMIWSEKWCRIKQTPLPGNQCDLCQSIINKPRRVLLLTSHLQFGPSQEHHLSSCIFQHTAAGGSNRRVSNCWLIWFCGCAEVEPLMFPPASVLPHPPNNILMSYTTQARLAGIRFSIKLRHKIKKKNAET